MPGTAGKNSVRLALNPVLDVDFGDAGEGGLVNAKLNRFVSQGKTKLPNKAFGWLVRFGILFKNLSVGNPRLACATSNNGANDGTGDFQVEFADEGVQPDRSVCIAGSSDHKNAPHGFKTFQIHKTKRKSFQALSSAWKSQIPSNYHKYTPFCKCYN